MRLAVRDEAGEVLIELTDLAGRQQQVLGVLAQLRDGALERVDPALARPATLAVRAGADAMRIRLRGHDAAGIPAEAIYSLLRRLLVERLPQAPTPDPLAAAT